MPLEAIWKNVVEKKMYITGGCGALYDGASPDGSVRPIITSRACTRPTAEIISLPNITAHNETCAAVGNVLWNWRMFRGDRRGAVCRCAGDSRSTTRCCRASVSDGTNYFYVNPLRQVEPLPTKLRWSRNACRSSPRIAARPMYLRTIAEVGGYAYSKTDDAIWINLYGSNKLSTTLDGHPLKLSQQTNYPWDGRVQITIDECPTDEFSLKLRIPGWADEATIRVNGSAVERESQTWLLRRTPPALESRRRRGTATADAGPAHRGESTGRGNAQSGRDQARADRVLFGVARLAQGCSRAGCRDPRGCEAIRAIRCRSY